MKWYERQKQLYAQKNQPEPPIQPQDNSYAEDSMEAAYRENEYMQEPETNMQSEDVVQEPQYNQYNNQDMQDYEDDDYYNDSFQTVNTTDMNATTISKGTLVNGNVEADGDLIIRGHIKGDVLCNANLSVYGVIEGTISCTNAFFDNAMIMGDIGCSGNMEITESSTIDGNIEAYNLLNGGRIKGNATVTEAVHFLSTSAIVGDMNANAIQVDRGAVIQGSITIRQDVYFNENNR